MSSPSPAPGAAGADSAGSAAAGRHQVPTHLDVEDRPFLGLTVRQVLVLAVGGTWAYAAWALAGGLPVALRLPLAAACVLLAAAGALGWGAWTLVALRYALTPRVAVWRLALAPAVGPRRPRAAPGRDAGEGWVAWRPVPVWATGEHRRCRPGAAPAVAGPGATPAGVAVRFREGATWVS